MVTKKLQDKFYAALESLKDGKNDYILEALAAGARATFESFDDPGYTGKLRADAPEEKEDPYAHEENYMRSNWPSKNSIVNPAGGSKNRMSREDWLLMGHDPDTDEEEDPVDLVDHFDDRSGNRFPSYRGQFTEKDYPAVAEAIGKLGKTIGAMKHKGNEALVESILEGFKACFK